MSWKTSLGCFSKDSIEHSVNGVSMKFRPVSVGAMFKLKHFQGVIAGALAILFTDTSADAGKKQVQRLVRTEIGGPNAVDSEDITEQQAISPELAALRYSQRQKAINDLMDALTKDESKIALGELILDSLRDHPWNQNKPLPSEFINEIEAQMLVGLLVGVAKANKGVFGPFVDQIENLFKTRLTINPKQDQDETAGNNSNLIASGASDKASQAT